MYIQANLPEDFGALEKIKRDNYPFNKALEHFIKNLGSLHKHLGLDFYDTLGYIESQLIFIGVEPRIDNTKSAVSIRIKTYDKDIIEFYDSSPISNKLTTVLIFKLIIRLSEIYNTSLNHMSYKLKSLEQDLSSKSVLPDTRDVVDIQPEIKKRKLIEVPVAKSTEKPKPIEKNVTTKVREDESIKTKTDTPSIDDLSQRAANILTKIEETKASPGTKVTSNPLLSDFL